MGDGWEGERPGDPATTVRARARRGWRWDPPDGCERVAWVLDFVADAAEARGHVAPAELRFAAVVAFLRAAARRRTQRNTARCDAARGNRRGERAEEGRARASRRSLAAAAALCFVQLLQYQPHGMQSSVCCSAAAPPTPTPPPIPPPMRDMRPLILWNSNQRALIKRPLTPKDKTRPRPEALKGHWH